MDLFEIYGQGNLCYGLGRYDTLRNDILIQSTWSSQTYTEPLPAIEVG